MNPRIRELLEEAFFDEETSQLVSDRMYTFSDHKMQLFAELIVRECIANCDDMNSMKYIANHFGIKIGGLE